MSDGPYDYAAERDDAENDARRRGWPMTRKDEAIERGYVEGDRD